jgi:hypothetical protein
MDLREIGWGTWTGSIWLRVGTGGGLLWIRWWTFEFHKMLGIFLSSLGHVSCSGMTRHHELVSYICATCPAHLVLNLIHDWTDPDKGSWWAVVIVIPSVQNVSNVLTSWGTVSDLVIAFDNAYHPELLDVKVKSCPCASGISQEGAEASDEPHGPTVLVQS